MCGEAAKLKTMGVLNQVPAATLIKLLTILQWNVRDGSRITPVISAVNIIDIFLFKIFVWGRLFAM